MVVSVSRLVVGGPLGDENTFQVSPRHCNFQIFVLVQCFIGIFDTVLQYFTPQQHENYNHCFATLYSQALDANFLTSQEKFVRTQVLQTNDPRGTHHFAILFTMTLLHKVTGQCVTFEVRNVLSIFKQNLTSTITSK